MWLRQFLLLLSLITLAWSTALSSLVCLDEDDAIALLNQARPHDALMVHLYSDLSDATFAALIQSYRVVRADGDTSGILDIRRYCHPTAWRPSTEPIVAFDGGTGINCTALAVDATTPPPMQVFILFEILACYEHLIVNSLCSEPNAVAIFVGYAATGAPIYTTGCAAGHVCADGQPDHGLFVATTVMVMVACVGLVVMAFVVVWLIRKHLSAEYMLLPRAV